MATPSVTYTFVPSTLVEAAEVNTNFADIVSFLENEVVHKDGSVAFTAIPSGPASDPTGANQLARKAYVDGRLARGRHVFDVSGTSANVTAAISFGTPLSSTPRVVATCSAATSAGTNIAVVYTSGISASGFTLRLLKVNNSTNYTTSIAVEWIAVPT